MAEQLTDEELELVRELISPLTSGENVNTVLDLDEATSLSLSDILYIIQGTGSNRDKKLAVQTLLNFIKTNIETLSKLHLTEEPTTGYSLRVEGSTYLKGGAIVSGSIFDVMSANIYLRGVTSAGKLTVSDTSSTYALEVTGVARFNSAVVVMGTLGASSLDVNSHQAGSGDGFSLSMTSNGLNVKDDDNASVFRVQAETAVTGETSRMDVAARVYFDGYASFESGARFYGNVNMGGNVDIGSPTSKKMFNVNGNDFYVGTDGTTHAASLEATSEEVTQLTASRAEVGRLAMNFSRVTANVNLNTMYSTAKQKERIVIYNDSSSNITATLDSTGNHTTVLTQCCAEFICVAYDSTNGPTWRPIEGRAPIN